MGDVLTSGDLHIGRNDLGQSMLVDSTEANIHPKLFDNLLVEDLCLCSNVQNSENKWLL